ncbi:hypothetical protein [Massilia agri]|uniref:PcRGLX/YetA-like N-terminal RIFT barrel domain-containing protein n=1 Tax=Massilia agri TaxID=1886785 RepID=A0ABT2AHE0_9BURK|nr:hypothetical protein [Massilia agri]MCS0595652.1 hypothetical protein [Massilia agri]
MKLLQSLTIRAGYTVLFGAALAACGGGGSSEQQSATLSSGMESGRTLASTAYIPQSRGTTTTTPSTNTGVADAVTDVRFESTSSAAQTNVPVTFGQVFAPGDLAADTSLAGRLDSGVTIPLQLDVKAKHPDGSVRHAVISAVLPTLAAGEVRTVSLVRTAPTAASAPTASALLNAGFKSSFEANIGGVRYIASADELIKQAAPVTWLNGSTVSEWEVSAPLKTSAGAAHPHLSARFAVRWYDAIKKARVDVTIENNWAYEPAPQNFTYNAQVLVGGNTVYAKSALTHYHHARWRKTFWWNGTAPQVNVKHNTGYLIASRALPNYDQSLSVPESSLSSSKANWTGAKIEPMGTGAAVTYMPSTGGRGDIGLLPQWNVAYLLSMDQRARDVALGTAELAGSFSAHYRDKKTGQPVSLIDYPYMTLVGKSGDTYNPATKRQEAFPACATSTGCKTPYTHDVSHQPGFAYLPYVLTGDHFFLEELQFWGMYSVFNSNPGYRDNIKGLVKSEQVRGQAWTLRTLAQVAYITPDSDRLKQHFTQIMDNNLAWFNANYTDNPAANKLGIIVNGYAIVYGDKTGVGPWQDDFFTSAVGQASDLGFTEATRLLKWKAKFPVDRMVASGACWIDGSIYSMKVRDSSTSPIYSSMAEAYKASHTADFAGLACGSSAMASALKLKVGEMTGYSSAATGYPSNMQPALAYGVSVSGDAGKQAWEQFMKRSVKPDYSTAAQFAIVPR